MALTVHVWSDIVCPWCFIGKRRFEAAVQKLGEPVEVEWHSFELRPGRSASGGEKPKYLDWLAQKFGFPPSRTEALVEHVSGVAREEGLDFRLREAIPAHTFDAHRLIHFAQAGNRAPQMKERLLVAHFTEGLDVEEPQVLARLAGEIGLDVERAAAMLASQDFAEEVRADEAAARELGISGVPFFVIGRYGVSGAQSADTFLGALDRAYAEEASEPASVEGRAESSEGAVCTPETC